MQPKTMQTSTGSDEKTGKRPWTTPQCREVSFKEVSTKNPVNAEAESTPSRAAS
jgi:hypothetical protein